MQNLFKLDARFRPTIVLSIVKLPNPLVFCSSDQSILVFDLVNCLPYQITGFVLHLKVVKGNREVIIL